MQSTDNKNTMEAEKKIEEDFEEEGLDEDFEEYIITLASSDEKKFKISGTCARISGYIKNILEADKNATDIPVGKIDGYVLGLIVEYLKHHGGKIPAEIKQPVRNDNMSKIVEDEWDAKFIDDKETKVIFNIILGANYMDIKPLLYLGCAKIATLIKGKSPEEIKKILSDSGKE